MSTFEPASALEVLVDHRVRFVVIGGVAAGLHGSSTVTGDLDICYARDVANLEALAAALRELDARSRGAPVHVPFQLDAELLGAGDHFTFASRFGDLDCLGTPAGTQGFDDIAANADVMVVGGIEIRVASLDDLIRMKRAAGRPKDRVELEILGALRDELGDATD